MNSCGFFGFVLVNDKGRYLKEQRKNRSWSCIPLIIIGMSISSKGSEFYEEVVEIIWIICMTFIHNFYIRLLYL